MNIFLCEDHSCHEHPSHTGCQQRAVADYSPNHRHIQFAMNFISEEKKDWQRWMSIIDRWCHEHREPFSVPGEWLFVDWVSAEFVHEDWGHVWRRREDLLDEQVPLHHRRRHQRSFLWKYNWAEQRIRSPDLDKYSPSVGQTNKISSKRNVESLPCVSRTTFWRFLEKKRDLRRETTTF